MATGVRRRRNRGDWQRLDAAYEAGDQTRDGFCAEHGVSASSLSCWRGKRHDSVDVAALFASQRTLQENNEKLQGQVLELKRQLEWFKRQLFGPRSERRLVEGSPDQLSLGQIAGAPSAAAPSRPVSGYTRQAPRRTQDEGSGVLRFDERVPVEVIEVGDPQADDSREVIGEKTTCRLAQRPGSYVVIKYVRKVFKDKVSGAATRSGSRSAAIQATRSRIT